MKTKLLNFLMLIFLSTGVLMAQEPARFGRGNPRGAEMNFRPAQGARMNEFLKLTEEQKKAVKQIWLKSAKETKPFKDELRELKAKHQTLTTAAKPDMDAIYKSIEKIGSVKVEMAKVLAKERQEFRALLTEEQRLKLDNSREKLKEIPSNFRNRGKRIF